MPSASDPRQQNRTRQPAPRPAQPGQRPAQPMQRSAQPTQRAAQQPGTRPSQPAGGRPGNHAPTHIMLMARTALLRPRARAIKRTPAVVPKRKAPRCP